MTKNINPHVKYSQVKKSVPSGIKSAQTEEFLMTGFQFTEYKEGKKSFSISAQSFYLRNKLVKPFGFRAALGKSAELEGVEATFYKDNKQVSSLYSKTAVMDIKKKDIIFEGKPALITEDKRTLAAEKIIWNNFSKRLEAEGRCILGMEGKRRAAESINTDMELRNFTIRGEETHRF